MAVQIAKVERSGGKATRVEATVGDIEVHYVILNGKPYEALKMRHGVQVLDRDTLRIPQADFLVLQRQVRQIFCEGRSTVKTGPIQGQLIPSTDLS